MCQGLEAGTTGSQQISGVNKEVGGAGRTRSLLAWGVQTRIRVHPVTWETSEF